MSELARVESIALARKPARFGRAHLIALVAPYACALIVLRDIVFDCRTQFAEPSFALFSAIVAPFFGPFLGRYATAGEMHTGAHPVDLFTPSLALLALGIASQAAPLSIARTRLFFWTVGWTAWFTAAFFSLMQVLG
ncbi:MAG TPA: hypothetical protein VM509_09370 [Planctomycetota bacterium]|nr:hypothetical protein [Planctomycetota bacterium]